VTVGRGPLRWYAATDLTTRAHVALRWATCPFGRLERLVPASGRILDWGCGHGLLAISLVERSDGRAVRGVDLDRTKVAAARSAVAASPWSDRVELAAVDAGARPSGRWDAIVVSDVLYLMDEAEQRATLAAACAALEPGGTLVVKEMAERPRWKAWATRVQEQLAVRALRLTATAGGVRRAPSPDLLVDVMAEAGLSSTVIRLDRGYHCPHVAVVGRAAPASLGSEEGAGRLG
jgi:2-polyprenyl-3-methyl-5-hydroxy-6-metoxy-1,4-benzoquinol methylase